MFASQPNQCFSRPILYHKYWMLNSIVVYSTSPWLYCKATWTVVSWYRDTSSCRLLLSRVYGYALRVLAMHLSTFINENEHTQNCCSSVSWS